MTSKIKILKDLPAKRKWCIYGIICCILIILAYGINISYAYYNNSYPFSIIANVVGDFDTGVIDSDVNIILYKKNENNKYVKTYVAPSVGFKFNNAATSCSVPCSKDDPTASCHYSYNEENRTFSLTSNQKVTCKFYFDPEEAADITIYILKEDSRGTRIYNEKSYSIINGIPAYGYTYYNYTCDYPVTSVELDATSNKFVIETPTKNTCYMYYNSVGESDITANIYVQATFGSELYNKVNYIPTNRTYVKSTTQTSRCYDNNNQTIEGSSIDYSGGYINITAVGKQTCDIYLDVVE